MNKTLIIRRQKRRLAIRLHTTEGEIVGRAKIVDNELPNFVSFGARIFHLQIGSNYLEIDPVSVDDTFVVSEDDGIDVERTIYSRMN